MTETLLEKLIEPIGDCLTVESARKIVALKADDAVQRRVDELAEKANLGTLTEREEAEYDSYLAVFHAVTIMRSKARRLLGV
jgi:hypothetical protein